MVEISYQLLLWVCLLGGLYPLILSLIGREPSWFSVGSAIAVEAMLLVQLVWSITLVSQGKSAVGDTVEFFGYLITALIIPPAAVIWAAIERSRWATLVLGVSGFTVAVMAVRMWQIWTGIRWNS